MYQSHRLCWMAYIAWIKDMHLISVVIDALLSFSYCAIQRHGHGIMHLHIGILANHTPILCYIEWLHYEGDIEWMRDGLQCTCDQCIYNQYCWNDINEWINNNNKKHQGGIMHALIHLLLGWKIQCEKENKTQLHACYAFGWRGHCTRGDMLTRSAGLKNGRPAKLSEPDYFDRFGICLFAGYW